MARMVKVLSNFSIIFLLGIQSFAQEAVPVKRTKKAKLKVMAPKGMAKVLPKKKDTPDGFVPGDPSQLAASEIAGSKQDLLQQELIKDHRFEAIIQYVRGNVSWHEVQKKPDPGFKVLINRSDKLQVGENSLVKFITHKRCVAVVYGPAIITAPMSDEADAWSIQDGNLRWICEKKSEEKLLIQERPVSLFESEIFYFNKKLFVIRGEAQATNDTLTSPRIYTGRGREWLPPKSEQHPYDLWTFNNHLPAPKESYNWPEPKKPSLYRIEIGPFLGGGKFNHPTTEITDNTPSDLKGFRLTYFFHPDKSPSKTYFFTVNHWDHDRSFQGTSFSGSSPIYAASTELTSINFGIRWDRERWGYYARLGLGEHKLKAVYYIPSSSYQNDVEHDVATLAFGLDKIFQFESVNWFGLYMSGEVQFMRSISSAKTKSAPAIGDTFYQRLTGVPISEMDLIIHAGPIFYF